MPAHDESQAREQHSSIPAEVRAAEPVPGETSPSSVHPPGKVAAVLQSVHELTEDPINRWPAWIRFTLIILIPVFAAITGIQIWWHEMTKPIRLNVPMEWIKADSGATVQISSDRPVKVKEGDRIVLHPETDPYDAHRYLIYLSGNGVAKIYEEEAFLKGGPPGPWHWKVEAGQGTTATFLVIATRLKLFEWQKRKLERKLSGIKPKLSDPPDGIVRNVTFRGFDWSKQSGAPPQMPGSDDTSQVVVTASERSRGPEAPDPGWPFEIVRLLHESNINALGGRTVEVAKTNP